MDSMRTLNTSLPNHNARRRQRPEPKPSAELLQAFKAAALSVTQLYKTATAIAEEEDDNEDAGVVDEEKLQEAHEGGYQAALDDLLGFLDDSELGLGDGEGWSVREWATKRLRGGEGVNMDDNAAKEEDVKMDGESAASARSGSTSPDLQRRRRGRRRSTSSEQARNVRQRSMQDPGDIQSSSPAPREGSHTTVNQPQPQQQNPEIFHFRSAAPPQPRQQHHDTSSSSSTDNTPSVPTRRSPTAIRLEVKPTTRSTRSQARNTHTHTNHQRLLERGSNGVSATASLGYGAGAKRKGGFMEFFDVSGPGDDYGGGKRGRLG